MPVLYTGKSTWYRWKEFGVPSRIRAIARRRWYTELHTRALGIFRDFERTPLESPKSGAYGFGAWLSLARAPGSGPGGRWFESTRPDQKSFYISNRGSNRRFATANSTVGSVVANW